MTGEASSLWNTFGVDLRTHAAQASVLDGAVTTVDYSSQLMPSFET